MWDLWWTKWHWDRFFSEFFGFPLSIYYSTVVLRTHIVWGMVRNVTIREIMEVEKNILEVTEEKRLRLFRHVKRMPGNRLPLKIL
jgi:hypothetical protein